MRTVAALFVEAAGPYSEVEGVDLWPVERDARLYNEAFPVVAHPPCARWCHSLAPLNERRYGYRVGDDGGCFASALDSVRRCGGVLEHPAESIAWRVHCLARPLSGGWMPAGLVDPGWTCEVAQRNYGHPARKRTWLYAVGVDVPSLVWGDGSAPDAVVSWMEPLDRRRKITKREASSTPPAFRDVLLDMARSVRMP